MPRSPFRLVTDRVSHDTVAALRELLTEAEKGLIIGLAFGAMFKGRKIIVNTTGECYRSPIFTIGICHMLENKMSRQAEAEPGEQQAPV